MSRSGYSDDLDNWDLIRWRGAVRSALQGKRGQAFLRETLDALDALPTKELIAEELEHRGGVCLLGAVGSARGLPMQGVDTEDRDQLGELFGIAPAMAAEIMFENDEGTARVETPRQRWERMRAWVVSELKEAP